MLSILHSNVALLTFMKTEDFLQFLIVLVNQLYLFVDKEGAVI